MKDEVKRITNEPRTAKVKFTVPPGFFIAGYQYLGNDEFVGLPPAVPLWMPVPGSREQTKWGTPWSITSAPPMVLQTVRAWGVPRKEVRHTVEPYDDPLDAGGCIGVSIGRYMLDGREVNEAEFFEVLRAFERANR